ncbi:MAG: hypothetical protein QF449_14545 [Alphaproteobacteria bacterium]|jgi:hypothetical protein|nr:hypothetical protein [Alphaproteobacteria bacterium]MDP6819244.1 hypothetical protein [Alphaproteobacteria bacterium]
MATMLSSGTNEMILACEAGAARVRAEYSPDTGGCCSCEACGGDLVANYIPLGLSNSAGEPVWVHIGPCHQQFVDNRRLAAERALGFAD